MASLTVSAGESPVTFIQFWTFPSQEHQKQFIRVIHEQFEIIMRMPGFVAMALHPGLNGTGAVVYAQWQSQEAYESGINDPRAKQGHNLLAQWGTSSSEIYRVDAIFLPITASREEEYRKGTSV